MRNLTKILTFVTSACLLVMICYSQEVDLFEKPILIEKSELPVLPKVFSKSNLSGIALIKVSVSATGILDGVSLIRSTGLSTLDSFLIDWIGSWKYLPKLINNETVASFTIISIRYDLPNATFESPPVNNFTFILPEPYLRLLEAKEGVEMVVEDPVEVASVSPLTSWNVVSIPRDIQQIAEDIDTVIEVTVNETGEVVDVKSHSPFKSEKVWSWLAEELLKTKWPESPGSPNRLIDIPLSLHTTKCRIEFGECSAKSLP